MHCLTICLQCILHRGTGVPAVLERQEPNQTAAKAEVKLKMLQYCRELDSEELTLSKGCLCSLLVL